MHPDFRADMTSPSSKAAVVVGQAEESEEEEELVDSKQELGKEEETKNSPHTRLGDARAGLAGLRLSSVTATVERTLGSLPSIDLPQWAPSSSSFSSKKSPSGNEGEPQYPSLLHKRLHERNGEVHADLHMFFQVRKLVSKSISNQRFIFRNFSVRTSTSWRTYVSQRRAVSNFFRKLSNVCRGLSIR